jgi:hypothetical protein
MSKKVEEKKKNDFEILVVHFTSHVAIGKALDVRTNISQGQIVLGECINISLWDDNFLRLDYTNKSDGYQAYSELVPMSQVSKILFKQA